MSHKVLLDLPDSLFERLKQLATKTGNTYSGIIRTKLDEGLSDVEDTKKRA